MDTPIAVNADDVQEVVKIVIIDDAFEKNFEVGQDDLQTFWTFLEDERGENHQALIEDFTKFKAAIGKEIGGIQGIDEGVLEELWQKNSEYPTLKQITNKLFEKKLEKLQPLIKIQETIDNFNSANGNLKFEVKTLPQEFDIDTELKNVDIVLLDYRLGTEIDDTPTQRAAKIATDIYQKFSKDEKLPLLVLMSSDERVLQVEKEFREATKWLKGLFYCITKNELTEQNNTELRLLIWKENAKEGLKIHEFIEAVSNSLDESKEKFIEALKDLSLQDYSYIANFTLKTEGQPLGDYMTWLFSSYLSDLVFDKNPKLIEAKDKIDAIEEFSPLSKIAQLNPSMRLVDMYESALFNVFASVEERSYALKQGLTFVNKDKKKIWLILNAECDLLRKPIPNITLIEGDLIGISENVVLAEQDIKLLNLDGENYRIKWLWKNTFTVREKNIKKFLRRCKFQPFGILRTPFFFKLQQYYFNQISRVGLPVSPPIYKEIEIELLSKLAPQTPEKLDTKNMAFLVSRKNKDTHEMECHFTIEFVKMVKEKINQIIQNNNQANGNVLLKARRLQQLSTELGKSNDYFIKTPSIKLKKSSLVNYFSDFLGIGLNCDLTNFSDDNWSNYCLIVNLISDPVFVTTDN